MGFTFQDNRIYEMPVFFGPSEEPKNPGLNGRINLRKPADIDASTVIFETDPHMLEALLPEGFSLAAPVLSVALCEFANIGQFAGHTYRLVNISVPTRFDGQRDHMRGDLILVMYENHGDPIVGGRDLLGYSKVYADIDRPAHDGVHVRSKVANWGFAFLDVDLDLSAECPDPSAMEALSSASEGKFNYKYIQSLPEKGQAPWEAGADASYPVVNPKKWDKPEDYPFTLMDPTTTLCAGTVTFHQPHVDDVPLSWHVIDYLSRLPVIRYLGAQHSTYNDPCDYSHCYRLR